MSSPLVYVLIIALVSATLAQAQIHSTVKEKAKRLFSDTKINVHVAPHTHDDSGWLKTVDQYYYGSNTSIYNAGVQYILDTVVKELERDADKNFVYVEMSFFQRWYFEQTEEKKESVKRLVKNGQLTFANGGWVMHDEAGSHFVSMIDQTTLGHRFLKDEFDYAPNVGWQIDPFGHSAIQPNLLGSDVGFDALYFGRIDYEDLSLRKQNKNLEFIWRSSKSLPDSQLFTGVFSDGNYQMPAGFNFDVCSNFDPIMDDPKLADYNLDEKVEEFIQAIQQEYSYTQGNHIMFKMGSDFHYSSANHWYKNLDKIMKYVNERDDRFNVFYSNPILYTYAKSLESDITWSVKSDDFFPYADCEHCYWGGYFTSRPTLKYFERSASSFLQVLKQLTTNDPSKLTKEDRVALFELTAAVGLVNHHDAITGTAKQHVTDDYMKILDRAYTTAEKVVLKKLGNVAVQEDVSIGACRATNASTCEISQSANKGDSIVVVAYNALPRSVSQQVTVYLDVESASVNIVVNEVNAEGVITPISDVEIISTAPKAGLKVAPTTLIFTARNIPAVYYSRFIIELQDLSKKGLQNSKVMVPSSTPRTPSFDISNDKVTLTFRDGLLEQMKRKGDGDDKSIMISNNLYYYIGYGSPGIKGQRYQEKDNRDPHLQNLQPRASAARGDQSTQESGAYIFRPSRADGSDLAAVAGDGDIDVTVLEGEIVTEVRQKFADWATQTVRLREGSELVELEWTVGPIPIDDNMGKEVISRFETDLDSQELVYTDANGREFQERLKNYRPTWDLRNGNGESEPVSGNYYPITAGAYIKDTKKGMQLTVLTDRAQGGASLASGQLEFMVHRRLLADDSRGVGEALNETVGGMDPYPTWERKGDGIVVSGTHYLLLSDINDAMKETRGAMDAVYQQLHVFYGKYTGDASSNPLPPIKTILPLSFDLPINVQLNTFETWSPNVLLVRLAHQFAVDEDNEMSAPVNIDLSSLLSRYAVKSIVEMSLSANQEKETMLANKIQWSTKDDEGNGALTQSISKPTSSDSSVTLNPMEIKTFFVYV